mmetsp:Transcript_4228/g.5566  ORF Transcript_4228/g.5566 Transcript_4228/m.5566 type:complete len:227 (-) Transcript_4228:319-999(-)|eukprot:CAMPEP_0198144816 /NCGR_PEP_ID=MMETSP1443-20131203/18688_1 /TAXON_ID=186043 /ORGANISM="Entomoneis sp., Strain CCMP2396" /LENGTH=226 /DNA_ID=CAMNT_0043808279 /DNA_START=63 /DNA_END=743 /DNA_ORIENTATION=-
MFRSLFFYAMLVQFGEQVLTVQGFVPPSPPTAATRVTRTPTATTTAAPHGMHPPTTSSLQASAFDPSSIVDISAAAAVSSSSWLLSTIDSDIAQIPDNEFAPIFAGGIMVMFGGLLSALIVGFILESKNLYASVIADSYAQGAEDEEFWKGLSEEEKKKTRELLDKIKNQSNGGNDKKEEPAAVVAEPKMASSNDNQVVAASAKLQEKEQQQPAKEASKVDMFSDY